MAKFTLERCIGDQMIRGDFVTKVQHLADRWYCLPVPQWKYWFWLVIARSGSVSTHGSPGGWSKTCGGTRGSDNPWRVILEHVQWREDCLLLNHTVSISNIFDIGYHIGSVSRRSWICRWSSHGIMMNMLVEGPWVNYRKLRPKKTVEAGWIDVVKWI